MNRRQILKAFVGAVATVAIGMKLSGAMPEPKPQEWTFIGADKGEGDYTAAWVFDYRSVIVNPNAIVKINTV